MIARNRARFEAHEAPALLGELAIVKLDRLCAALQRQELRGEAIRVLDLIGGGWGALPARALPHWQSDITDDGTPLEFSIACEDDAMELRLLVEPQERSGTLHTNWQLGLDVNQRLSRERGVSLERFEKIAHLFAPSAAARARFAIWHAAAINSDGARFKTYLNPQIHGSSSAPDVVQQALAALDTHQAWPILSGITEGLGEYVYFSLDLTPAPTARIKVYKAYPLQQVEALARRLNEVNLIDPDDFRHWLSVLVGEGPELHERGIQVCYAFRSNGVRPEITLYVPVRNYCGNDAEALRRAQRFISPNSFGRLNDALREMAGRPLEIGRGLLTYVALRAGAVRPRVTLYLSPELYAIGAPRPVGKSDVAGVQVSSIRELRGHKSVLTSSSFAGVLELIDTERRKLEQHPFLAALCSQVGTPDEVRRISRRVAFFVMCFQDVLRLAHSMTSDPRLKTMAKRHEAEDHGHDRWYLQDLESLGVHVTLDELFSREGQAMRDIAYTQVSDVLRSHSDLSRLAVVLSLEAAGAEFFQAMIEYIERQRTISSLSYFARRHQRVEESHDILGQEAQEDLSTLLMSDEERPEVEAVVCRTFQTMTRLADDLHHSAGGSCLSVKEEEQCEVG
jgi:DMATS type aromatic prenyltransferase